MAITLEFYDRLGRERIPDVADRDAATVPQVGEVVEVTTVGGVTLRLRVLWPRVWWDVRLGVPAVARLHCEQMPPAPGS